MKRTMKLKNGHTIEDLTLKFYGGNTQVTRYMDFYAWDKQAEEWVYILDGMGFLYFDDYEEEEGETYYDYEGETFWERFYNYVLCTLSSDLNIDMFNYKFIVKGLDN